MCFGATSDGCLEWSSSSGAFSVAAAFAGSVQTWLPATALYPYPFGLRRENCAKVKNFSENRTTPRPIASCLNASQLFRLLALNTCTMTRANYLSSFGPRRRKDRQSVALDHRGVFCFVIQP